MHHADGRVVSNFIVQALQGAPITIYGTGKQTRSFCYVQDMVEGLIKLMATGDEKTGPVNLGNPDETSIRSLAERIITLTGSDSDIVCRPLPDDDPKQRCPDITLAIEELEWRPNVQIDEGLNRTIDYFRNRLIDLEIS